jgi:hypothetical protein
MAKRPQPIPLRFWRSSAGKEDVRDWLVALSLEDKRIIGHDLSLGQFGWPLACHCAGRLVAGFGRRGRHCQETAKPAFCFAFMTANFSRFMLS